ncbi:MAG: Hcp family type VI secretion system effector [Pirellula sp.]|jgi:type VI secretion system secreted protein Hcp
MILLSFKTKIKGESEVVDHTEWIKLDSVSFGVSRPIDAGAVGKKRETGAPSFTSIMCTKPVDIASVELFMQSISGKSLEEAYIHFIQTGGDKTDQVFLKVTLAEPVIESYNFAGSDPYASESFSINFIKMKMQHIQFDGDTKTEGSEKGWDVTKGEAW